MNISSVKRWAKISTLVIAGLTVAGVAVAGSMTFSSGDQGGSAWDWGLVGACSGAMSNAKSSADVITAHNMLTCSVMGGDYVSYSDEYTINGHPEDEIRIFIDWSDACSCEQQWPNLWYTCDSSAERSFRCDFSPSPTP